MLYSCQRGIAPLLGVNSSKSLRGRAGEMTVIDSPTRTLDVCKSVPSPQVPQHLQEALHKAVPAALAETSWPIDSEVSRA